MLAAQGVKPTLIFAGSHKVDGNPFEPLSDAVRADLQASGWRGDQTIPLSVTGGEILGRPRWLPGLRAGGFIAVARAF